MTKTDVVKNVVSAVVGFGVSAAVRGVIKNNTAPEKVHEQVAITGASYVIGAVVASRCKDYTDAKIDEIATFWNENVKGKKTEDK